MMENILNIFHFSIFFMLNKVHVIFNKINPLWLLFKIPFIEKYHNKHHHNPRDKHNKLWTDSEIGFNIWFSNIILGLALSFILTFLFVIIINGLFFFKNSFVVIFIGSLLLSFLISYVYVLKDDKYLVYFKKYESWREIDKRMYLLLSILFLIGSTILFSLSFI